MVQRPKINRALFSGMQRYRLYFTPLELNFFLNSVHFYPVRRTLNSHEMDCYLFADGEMICEGINWKTLMRHFPWSLLVTEIPPPLGGSVAGIASGG